MDIVDIMSTEHVDKWPKLLSWTSWTQWTWSKWQANMDMDMDKGVHVQM